MFNSKVKRICAAVLAAAVAGSLVGCADKTEKTGGASPIVWYLKKPIDNMSSYDIVMGEANKTIKKEVGTTLDFKLIENGSYDEKLNVLCASGDKFDIAYVEDTAKFQQYIKSGAFIPIDDLLEKYGKDILAMRDDISKEFSKYEGKQYAVDSQTVYSVAQSLVFKKDLVEKYNFDYKSVKSYYDLEPFLKQIKDNEPGMIPLFHSMGDFVNNDVSYSSIEGIVFDEVNEKFVLEYDIPKTMDFLRLKNDYYKKGYIASDAISRDGASERNSGKYAVFNNGGYYSEDGSKATATFGFPCVETFTGNTVISPKLCGRNAISATSKQPEKAIQLLNLIWKDENLLNTLAYGIEGVNYTVNEERTKELGKKSVNVQSGNKQTWAIWHNWLGYLWGQWDSAWNSAEALENMKKVNESATKSKTLGFAFDTEPVKSEAAKITAAATELGKVIQCGCMTDFDTYMTGARKKLMDSGAQKVLDEMNKQYTEWKKNKD